MVSAVDGSKHTVYAIAKGRNFPVLDISTEITRRKHHG